MTVPFHSCLPPSSSPLPPFPRVILSLIWNVARCSFFRRDLASFVGRPSQPRPDRQTDRPSLRRSMELRVKWFCPALPPDASFSYPYPSPSFSLFGRGLPLCGLPSVFLLVLCVCGLVALRVGGGENAGSPDHSVGLSTHRPTDPSILCKIHIEPGR